MNKDEVKLQSVLNKDQISAIVSGNFEDIFSVLGMHDHPTDTRLLVRAYLPGAVSVDVLAANTGRKVATLRQIDQAGLFEAGLGRRRNWFDYRLRVRYPQCTVIVADPYSFASCLNDDELYLFGEGTQEHSYRWMGAHPRERDGVSGVQFVVWAPAARRVSVVGDFNDWNGSCHVMRKHPASGIWEIFIPDVKAWANYKYEIIDAHGTLLPHKSDPYARSMQHPPETSSRVVLDNEYQWSDEQWMSNRRADNSVNKPVLIYEVHAGSWRRKAEQNNRYLSYCELADELVAYVVEMGFTHIQLMPISEYPFDGSWGYQPVGLYAPSIRFGTPSEFKYFVDCCHRNNIGVLLDWVPGHFPADEHGLGRYDGSCLYEHEDVRKGFHPDWNTLIYNYGRGEIVSYLLSNAHYWLDEFHIDGLRVDAVASMLYLDYSREEGEWLPNEHGGRENLEAVALLQKVNSSVYFNYPGIMMIAEESTAWPGVSKPIDSGGLGFGYKWNMGWMNDMLSYVSRDPIHRQYHHNELTFGLMYAFSENFVLPLSHDEVVHGKGSLIGKMPGDDWQKLANLRAFYGFMWTHPGKKLLFMGGEFAQQREWNHDQGLDWHLLERQEHRGVKNLVSDLNRVCRQTPALYQLDTDASGFEWLDADNQHMSIFSYLRKGVGDAVPVIVIINMTPTPRHNYQVGVPVAGRYRELINTDSEHYGGSNVGNGNGNGLDASEQSWQGQPCSLQVSVPPLATLILQLKTTA
jgi:1,4-alpha-glucan branching enzyme